MWTSSRTSKYFLQVPPWEQRQSVRLRALRWREQAPVFPFWAGMSCGAALELPWVLSPGSTGCVGARGQTDGRTDSGSTFRAVPWLLQPGSSPSCLSGDLPGASALRSTALLVEFALGASEGASRRRRGLRSPSARPQKAPWAPGAQTLKDRITESQNSRGWKGPLWVI